MSFCMSCIACVILHYLLVSLKATVVVALGAQWGLELDHRDDFSTSIVYIKKLVNIHLRLLDIAGD